MGKGTRSVGLIAGEGFLPQTIAEAMEVDGYDLHVLAIEDVTSPEIETPDRSVTWLPLGNLQAIIDRCHQLELSNLILVGRITITTVFKKMNSFDRRLRQFLQNLNERGGNAILAALVSDLERDNFHVMSNIEVVPDLITPRGLLAGPDLSRDQWSDIRFAWRIVKWISAEDIGQTVVVKNLAVVALEAMEGTNLAIRRAGELVGGGMVVVKVASPLHDFRFDVPTIGPQTIDVLARSGGSVLAVEAGRSFLLKRDETLSLCESSGISLLGIDKADLKER
jgi:DUF1009 family protein